MNIFRSVRSRVSEFQAARDSWLSGAVPAAACLFAVLLPAAVVMAQQQPNTPHVGYVYPAGSRAGTTSQVRVGGRFLDGVSGAEISGRGVSARIIEHDKPMTIMQINDLREKLQELVKKAPADPASRQEAQALRMRIGDSLRRNANPMIAEYVTVEVVIAPDAEPGLRQLRLATPLGLTEPLVFAVGQFPEFSERDVKTTRADTELTITLPATVNGRMIPGDADRVQAPLRQGQQYTPGDVDRYRFAARKGQDLVIAASARELMPYLADAVPGWFQADAHPLSTAAAGKWPTTTTSGSSSIRSFTSASRATANTSSRSRTRCIAGARTSSTASRLASCHS